MDKFTEDEYIVTMFEIVSGQPTQVFNYYVEYKDGIYSLKEGRTIYTNICPVEGAYKPLISMLKRNQKLKSYLNRIDFKKVVGTKIRKLEQAGYSDYTEFLCPKEEAIRQSMLNEKLYDQESIDISKAKGTIKKQK